MESQLKSPALTMRVLKFAMVASAFLFILVAVEVPVQPGPPVSRQFQLVIALVGVMSVAAGFLVPRFAFRAAQGAAQELTETVRLQRWMTKGVLSLALFEACILFGLMLHLMNGSTQLVELLFALGIAAEVMWSPDAPPAAENGMPAQG